VNTGSTRDQQRIAQSRRLRSASCSVRASRSTNVKDRRRDSSALAGWTPPCTGSRIEDPSRVRMEAGRSAGWSLKCRGSNREVLRTADQKPGRWVAGEGAANDFVRSCRRAARRAPSRVEARLRRGDRPVALEGLLAVASRPAGSSPLPSPAARVLLIGPCCSKRVSDALQWTPGRPAPGRGPPRRPPLDRRGLLMEGRGGIDLRLRSIGKLREGDGRAASIR